MRIANHLTSEINGARLVVLPQTYHNTPVRAGVNFTQLLT